MRSAAIWMRVAIAGVTVLAMGWVPAPAIAHPLGNFTINTSAALVLLENEVLVDFTLDMAEIPTLQEEGRLDRDGDGSGSAEELDSYRTAACENLRTGLRLRIDGNVAPLTRRSSELSLPVGQAGLSTLRLRCVFATAIEPAPVHDLRFEDRTYPDRLGWREVTAAGDGATIVRSDVPGESPSGRLRSYPTGVPPSHVLTASLAFRPGGAALRADPGSEVAASPTGGFLAGFAARPDLSAGLIALMVAAAVGVGAIHALGPGHGKSLIGAYLIGADGTLRQAVAVGAAVSVMHTASVLGLGLLVLSAERVFAPERVYPWLGLASGLVALGLGAALLVSRIHSLSEGLHGHDHLHPDRPLSRRGLVALAFAGGILPSPSAVVVLLGSVAIGRAALGLVLIAAFSAGLAASLVAVGVLAIRARHVATGRLPAGLMRLAPVLSAGCIALVGLALTGRGLLQL
jgi:ABC-type nickel/cobalt efflux system permease component RcnA